MSIAKALLELTPGAKWVIRDDVIDWMDTEQTQPTQEELVQKIAEIKYTEEVEAYKETRFKAYPLISEQLDKIFHEGIDAWKVDIQAIKDAHPKAVIDNTVLNTRKNQALFDLQVKEYTKAKARIAQYQLSVGVPESTKTIVTGKDSLLEDITETITIPAIPALDATIEVITQEIDKDPVTSTVANPLIVKDNEERTAAQLVIDNTPQPVKDQVDGV
jgi:hypothetical protein